MTVGQNPVDLEYIVGISNLFPHLKISTNIVDRRNVKAVMMNLLQFAILFALICKPRNLTVTIVSVLPRFPELLIRGIDL